MRGNRRIRARLAIAALTLAAAGHAAAHDFWIQPARWRLDPASALEVSLLAGHGSDRQRSQIPASRIIRFEAISPEGRRTDLRLRLHLAAADGDATVSFPRAGTYLLALDTDARAESHLPAARFNDYLRVEGLTPAIDLRARTRRADADGSENYSRHAKTIVQVGPVDPRGQSVVTRPVGMSLEIVPERSPLVSPRPASFTVRIYYHGRPLAGALVKLTDLAHDAQPVEQHRSGADGRASFATPGRGDWLVNVIWTRPQPAGRLTDFETDFASLSFSVGD